MSSPRVKILLAWCDENGIQIDSRIQVVEQELADYPLSGDESSCSSSPDHGISVYSLEDCIDCSCVLVHIPKTAILSTKSSFLSQDIASAPYGHTAHLALALALYGEILRGQDSRWFGYIQSLPRVTVDIAIFWGIEDVINFSSCLGSSRGRTAPSQSAVDNVEPARSLVELPEHTPSLQLRDGKQARMWLSCTEAEKELDGLMDEIHQYYVDVVEPTLRAVFGRPRQAELEHDIDLASGGGIPLLDEHSRSSCELNSVKPSLPGFCHAYSLVSSRAFSVDLYHGLAMVPIADAFNHSNENHVHMESDYDVCVECGSLAECDHDGESIAAGSSRGTCSLSAILRVDPALEVDTLDMCSVKPILPRSEAFNTYGSLSNAELISRYGFALAENEHDIVRLGCGSFASLINRLIILLHPSPAGNDADIYEHLRVRNPTLAHQDGGTSRHEPSGDFAAPFLRMYLHLARLWATEPRWDDMGDDGMVYNVPPVSSSWPQREEPDSAVPEIFNINVEGKLTHAVWLFCVLFANCICSPETMTKFTDSIRSSDHDDTLQRFMEDVKRDLLDVQNYVDDAIQMTEGDEEVSASAPSDVRGDSNFIVAQNLIDPETCVTPIVATEVHASEDSDFFIPGFHTPTCRTPGLDHHDTFDLDTRSGDTDVLAHADTSGLTLEFSGDPAALARAQSIPEVTPEPSGTPAASPRARSIPEVPSEPSSTSHAIVSSRLRSRRFSVEEGRSQKRPRLSSPHTLGNEDLPSDIFSRPMSSVHPGEDIIRTRGSTSIAERRAATHDHRVPVAKTLARTVVHLCQQRIDFAVPHGKTPNSLTAAEIGELLDETPSRMHRTRMAMLLALGEKSILESCAATWGAILGNDGDDNNVR